MRVFGSNLLSIDAQQGIANCRTTHKCTCIHTRARKHTRSGIHHLICCTNAHEHSRTRIRTRTPMRTYTQMHYFAKAATKIGSLQGLFTEICGHTRNEHTHMSERIHTIVRTHTHIDIPVILPERCAGLSGKTVSIRTMPVC